MNQFRILVVDNDEQLLRHAKGLEKTIPGLKVTAIADLGQAREAIDREFFHVAFIDLRLRNEPTRVSEGQLVLKELQARRPACRRYLLTVYITENRAEVFGLLDPRSQVVESVVDKANLRVTMGAIVKELAESWLESRVEIEPLSDLAAEVLRKCGPRSDAAEPYDGVSVTTEEVDTIVSRILGQGRRRFRPEFPEPETPVIDTRDLVRGVSLVFERKGRSKSVVATGRPVTTSGFPGVYCAIKISPRHDALEERDRYERYVRLGLSAERRAELLRSAMGDSIGALCYGFAGSSPSNVTDLESLFEQESVRSFSVLETLFGSASHDWRNTELAETGQDLAEFFWSAYGLEPDPIMQQLTTWVEKNADRWGMRYRAGSLLSGSVKLTLPCNRDYTTGPVRGEYQSCVVHGDLNAANVMVADDGRVMLIDFRHTTRGPRTLDAAALETSARMVCDDNGPTSADLALQYRIEAGLARNAWSDDFRSSDAYEKFPFWARISATLRSHLKVGLDDLAPEEYIATCLLYVTRVLRATKLTEAARFRLLVWASVLCEQLRDSSR